MSGSWFSWKEEGITSNQVNREFVNVCSEFANYSDISSALDNFRRLQILDHCCLIDFPTIKSAEKQYVEQLLV